MTNKKKILILPIICIILFIVILVIFFLNMTKNNTIANNGIEEIDKLTNTDNLNNTSGIINTNNIDYTNNDENNLNADEKENGVANINISEMFEDKTENEEYMNYVSSEEYKNKVKNQMLDEVIYSSRNMGSSPTYKFRSSDFDVVPYNEDWQMESFLKVYLPPEELNKYINDIEVFNLEETKTNFIVYKLQVNDKDAFIIISMYASENTKQIVYQNLNESFDNYFDMGIDLLNRLKELGAIKVELKGEINE